MKKNVYLFCIVLVFLIPIRAICGEVVTTPSPIVLSSPTTDQVEKLRMTFFYGSDGNHRVVIWYDVLSSDGSKILKRESVVIYNHPDYPFTDVNNCVAEDDPHDCCTGPTTGDCDESTTDFTDFVQGFGTTLKDRGDLKIWQDIQSKYTTQ